jgi:hypothetical protein
MLAGDRHTLKQTGARRTLLDAAVPVCAGTAGVVASAFSISATALLTAFLVFAEFAG